MATHRYWRLDCLTNGNSNLAFAIAEISLASSIGGSNLVGSGTAAASTVLGAPYVAANAFDGNPATFWSSDSSTPAPQWISYDFGLGNAFDILEVMVTARNDGFAFTTPLAFDLQFSDNNSSWTTYGNFLASAWSVGQTKTFDVLPGVPNAAQSLVEAVAADANPPAAVAQDLIEANAANANPPSRIAQTFFEAIISTVVPPGGHRSGAFAWHSKFGAPKPVPKRARRRRFSLTFDPLTQPVRVNQALLEVLVPFSDTPLPSIRFFEFVNNTLIQQNQQTVPAGITGLARTGESIWLLGAAPLPQFRWTAPFTLSPILQGWISIYNGSTFVSAVPGIEHMPSTVTWDVSGTVWVATTENDLYHIDGAGTILARTTIPPYPTQNSGVPLGMSSLAWWTNNKLYGGSAFNGLLVQVSGAA